MKLKVLTVTLSVGLLALLFVVSRSFFESVRHVLAHIPAGWWAVIAAAVALQLLGHWLRMLRTKTITDYARKGKPAEQFGALAVGYFFNTLLPLRAGEIVRALLISMRLQISFIYTFVVVLIERIIDLLVIGCIVILVSLLFSGHVALLLLLAAVSAIVLSIALLVLLILLVQENRRLLNIIWRITGWFNPRICNNLRFKTWSLTFGLQQFIRRKEAVRRYLVLTVASWVCYIMAMTVLTLALLPHLTPSRTFVAATAPYIAVTAPSGPAYVTSFERIIQPVVDTGAQLNGEQYVLLAWLILTVPMCGVGFAVLIGTKITVRRRSSKATQAGFANKLLRNEDVSQEFPGFLDSYFTGNDLARVLHRLEMAGELSLVKFFKGGSDAITILVLSKDKLFVKKIIPLEYQDRLKAQYDWLKKHQKLKYLVRVLGEQRTKDYYAIDLAYDSENIPFFEYIHSNSLPQSKEVVKTAWTYLFKRIYDDDKKIGFYPKKRDAFIEKHIFGCIEKAMAASPDLRRAIKPERITINGQEYDNLYQIMEKIKQHPQASKDIATFRLTDTVHGDMTIDNILVSPRTNKPLIIDPAPDGNIINGPVFDMGKLAQSFYCGYEFLFRNNDPVTLNSDGSINYRDHRSAIYTKMWSYLRKELAPQYLSESEQRALLFHAAALHIRVLKHRVYINPGNVLQFYATGVRTLNAFLDQYNQD